MATMMTSLKVGDPVNVPGDMYGTLKFIGPVDGKKGTFAGVQLAPEFASRGKNSGDVDGKQYFRTSIEGSGIFLPVSKAEKRVSGSSQGSAATKYSAGRRLASGTASPTTPGTSRISSVRTPGLQKPNFSQTVGPGSLTSRTASPPALKPPTKRESLPRPQSPLRPRPSSPLRKVNNMSAVQTPAAGKLQTPRTRPSVGLAKSTIGTTPAKASALRAPSLAANGPNKFSQSLRQSTSATPGRMHRPGGAVPPLPLGPDDRFDEDESILELPEAETTPTPAAGRNLDMTSTHDLQKFEQEKQHLQDQLAERDRQLHDQAASIAEMESSLTELQKMLPTAMSDGLSGVPNDEADLPRDVQALRAALRDKNDRIKALTAEFDNNRADFRSTIDTLEMASTETERVYEQRVEDLMQQVQQLQDRNEDVEGVAQQFHQLESMVQELEEGLEDSRRAEAEARAEAEFLRGEVERKDSELRREKERHAAQAALEGGGQHARSSTNEEVEELQMSISQKDDEIRGLKVIIQNLQRNGHDRSPSRDDPVTPKTNGVSHARKRSANILTSPDHGTDLAAQIRDLESLLQQKNNREEELREEVQQLRRSVNLSTQKWSFPSGGTSGALGLGHRRTDSEVEKHTSGGSQRTIVGQNTPGQHKRKDSTIPGYNEEPSGRGSPLKDTLGIDTNESEEENERRRRRSAELRRKHAPQAPPSVSEASTAGQYCEICEEHGHDILSCAAMMDSSGHRPDDVAGAEDFHDADEYLRNGRDVVREGLRRSHESGSDKPAPLRKTTTSSLNEPPHPPPMGPLPPPPTQRTSSISTALTSHASGGSKNTSRPSSSQKPSTQPAIIEGTGDQAGMVAGKTSGVIDSDKWCALCEKDGHDSVDCPTDAF